MSHYQEKLLKLVKANPGDVPEALSEMIKKARAHAGGKTAADNKKAKAALPAFLTPKETSEGEWRPQRTFIQMSEITLGEDGLTPWLQIMPGPGKWNHPKYGMMKITQETCDRYAENFQNKVYQEHIPVDAEHKTKLSGALAYYREMRASGPNDEPGVWAKLEMTERGKELLASGGFKYFSPEMYDDWEDPATGITHKDIITGGAFTTRPFFKDGSLQPIAASELAVYHGDGMGMDCEEELETVDDISDVIIDMVSDGLTDAEINGLVNASLSLARAGKAAYDRLETPEGTATFKETSMEPKTEETKTVATEEKITPDPAQFSELKTANAELTKQFTESQAQIKAYAERVEVMETEGRLRRFTEVVTGKGGANDGGPQFFGDAAKHVGFLNKLSLKFGEESEEVTDYIEQQKASATAIATSASMAPIGKAGASVSGSVEDSIGAEIKAYSETNKMSLAAATAAVLNADPQKYAEYDREQKRRAKNAE